MQNIKEGKSPFFEPGLDDLLNKHINSTKLLKLSSNLPKEVKNAEVIFITVGTPSRRLVDDSDLSSVYDVVREIAANIDSYSVIVTKSGIPETGFLAQPIKKETIKVKTKNILNLLRNIGLLYLK